MHRGFIKIWRRIKDSIVFKDSVLLHLWIYCLLKAAYKPERVIWPTGKGNTIVELKRGQLLFGRNAASKELGPAGNTLADKLKKLENLKKVEKTMGMKFGDPFNPLLVSVRSGAKFSMPGMMDTVLNLGLNETTARCTYS